MIWSSWPAKWACCRSNRSASPRNGGLQPGKIFLVDMKQGRIVDDREIKSELVDKRPWRRWIEENMVELDKLPAPGIVHQPDHDTLLVRQHAFGYTTEDIKIIISPMAVGGLEGLGSMGTDTPLACLSEKPQLLYGYFKQLFAQVTNPPLDANFEELVTSLYTYLGREGNLLDESPKACRLVKLKQPILTNADLERLRELSEGESSLGHAADAVQRRRWRRRVWKRRLTRYATRRRWRSRTAHRF